MSSANLMMVLESGYTVVYREYSRRLKTQLWDAPVLRMRVEEVSRKKSRTHMHSEVFNPRSLSSVTSLKGTMALNAEL